MHGCIFANKGRLFLILVTILIHNGLSFGQQDILVHGVVVEQNSRYHSKKAVHYLSGVSIQINKGVLALSGQDGRFLARLSDVQPGAPLRILAEKAGFEVVNQREMEQAAVAGRLSSIRIVMCTAGTLARNRVAYYNIAVEAVEEQYRRQVALLEMDSTKRGEAIRRLEAEYAVQLTGKDAALQLLKQQRDAAMAQASALSRQFVETNLDDADSLFVLAYEAFLEKRIDDVLRILEYERLERNILQAQENIEAGQVMQGQGLSLKNRTLTRYGQALQGCREVFTALLALGDTMGALIHFTGCMPADSLDAAGLIRFCDAVLTYHNLPRPLHNTQYRNDLTGLIISICEGRDRFGPEWPANDTRRFVQALREIILSTAAWKDLPQNPVADDQWQRLDAAIEHWKKH